MNRQEMISKILLCVKANGLYVSGDFFLMLAFRTERELREICRELHISEARR